MPTIRGNTRGIDDAALKKIIDQYVDRIVRVVTTAGKEVMKELRIAAVKRWYNSTAANAMNNATKVESDSPKQNKDTITITIRSYVDVNEYEAQRIVSSERNLYSSPYNSVVRWRERHEIGNRDSEGNRGGTGFWTYYDQNPSKSNPLRKVMSMPYSIGEYLFKLPWEEGIFGLPPQARDTGTGWVNPKNSTKGSSLKEYVEEDIKNKAEKKVNEKFWELYK